MIFRSITISEAGEVAVRWETENGSKVTVSKAFPRPDSVLATAMQGVIPQVAEWRHEPKSETRMFLRGISVTEKTVRVKGQGFKDVTIIRLNVAENCDGSDRAAVVRFPAMTEEIELPGQTVMWPDMRHAVSELVAAAEQYCEAVRGAM